MNRTTLALAVVTLLVCRSFSLADDTAQQGDQTASRSATRFDRSIGPLLETYCSECHGGGEMQGNLALDNIDPCASGGDFEVWRMIYQRVRFGEMPPGDARQPRDPDRNELLQWIRGELLKTQQPGSVADSKLSLPQYGNYVDHETLFAAAGDSVVIPGPPRLWRLRPKIYASLMIGDAGQTNSHRLSEPLNVVRGAEFKDYAARYFVDEPTMGMLLANAESIVPVRSRDVIRQLSEFESFPTQETVDSAIESTFLNILHREPTMNELARFARFHRRVFDEFGSRTAAEKLLTAIYLQPETLFREELGAGSPDEHGRLRLSQLEIALAISYALGQQPDELLLAAGRRSELRSREQVISHLQRRFDSPPEPEGNPRVLEFFREYFNYPYASDVFKQQPKYGIYLPGVLTTDLDLLIDHIVNKDEEVLFHLLTTQEYFVDCRRDPRTGKLSRSSSDQLIRNGRSPSESEYASVYGLPRDWIWTDNQPVAVPRHMRAGVLTHPAWLAAWSGNFDNHPVQRGKWIRTHLLGGTVPDVPIGVEAILADDDHKQLRQRLAMATAGAECWRCHKKMDPLGLPLEQYDHYGRFRVRERGRPVNASGSITYVDDDALLGDVDNPLEMIHRLAASEHVEQVFVRHVFRYFMGRNETLGDAKTLWEAHRVYRDRGGSFRSLVISLLSSDSFLLRSVNSDQQRSGGR